MDCYKIGDLPDLPHGPLHLTPIVITSLLHVFKCCRERLPAAMHPVQQSPQGTLMGHVHQRQHASIESQVRLPQAQSMMY